MELFRPPLLHGAIGRIQPQDESKIGHTPFQVGTSLGRDRACPNQRAIILFARTSLVSDRRGHTGAALPTSSIGDRRYRMPN